MLSSLLPSSLAFLAESDLTIGIKHTSAYGFRREQLDRLLRSIRRRYATAEVIVADDGCKADRTAARTHNVTLVCTEAGSGLSLGRNTIVRRASTEFVLLLDDDVVFSEATDLAALHDALVRDPGAALAGGCYDDLEGGDADCFNLAFSVTGGGTAVAARFATLQAQGGGCGVVDATHNFFLARRSALVQHGWDARQKLMEHQAFFYALWLHGLRVLACPAVRVQHPRKRGPRARHAGVRQTAQRLGDRGRTSSRATQRHQPLARRTSLRPPVARLGRVPCATRTNRSMWPAARAAGGVGWKGMPQVAPHIHCLQPRPSPCRYLNILVTRVLQTGAGTHP